MTDARTIAELRWDGPMPPAVIDRLEHGSAAAAEIARVKDSIAFFHGEIARVERSAKRWAERGNDEMARRNLADVELYRREWRRDRARLKDLRATEAGLKGAKRFFDVLNPKEPS